MSNLYVYRIVVESYPTEDGQPWDRYYTLDYENEYAREAPDWLRAKIEHALTTPPWGDKENLEKWLEAGKGSAKLTSAHDAERIIERLRIKGEQYRGHDVASDEPTGVVMPKPWRKHYLSGSGGHALVNDFNAFGAVARLERSQKVLWEPEVPEITQPII
jgi:hypothetical protein